MRSARIPFFIILWITFHIFCHSVYPLEKPTHGALNEYISRNSINNFSLDAYLKQRLGILQGVGEIIYKGNRIFQWLAEGGEKEDEPDEFYRLITNRARAINHFHNPLATWDKAGFDQSPPRGQSSILWAQNPNQNIGGKWSWPDARKYFYKGLTSTVPFEKNEAFAHTFRALGQLMHLVQDASVPSHARNDLHFLDYELWLENIRSNEDVQFKEFLRDPISFKREIFLEFPNKLAPIPIAKLIDTDKYKGDNPDVTKFNSIGLAEYASANFFSEHTIWNSEIPFPKLQNATITPYKIPSPRNPSRMVRRPYYQKTADGDTGYRLARAGFLFNYITKYISVGNYLDNPGLDGGVYADYAQRLIPRAIGYSASLLEYFFRGNIEISLPKDGFYSMIETKDQDRGFTRVTLMARNVTPDDEEMPDGSIQLVVHYKLAQEDPFQNKPVAVSEDFIYIVVPEKKNIRSIPRDQGVLLEFDLTDSPIPLYATDVYLQLVYKGKLGLEDDAVAVGFKDISEPTPMTFFNNMDLICINGSWYPAGSPAAIAQVDENQNGKADGDEWDVYRHNATDFYLRFSPLKDAQFVDAKNYHFYAGLILAGDYVKVYILSDYQFYYSHMQAPEPVDADDAWFHYFETILWEGNGVWSQLDYHEDMEVCCRRLEIPRCGENDPSPACCERVVQPGCPIRTYPEMERFRGILMWSGTTLVKKEYPPGCFCPELD